MAPHRDMIDTIDAMIGRYANIEAVCVEYIRHTEVEERVRALAEQGCELIIARGLYAELVRQTVRLPVVEIRVTAQEIAELVVELKAELPQERPRIALVSFSNMLCDTSKFSRLFGVDFVQYPVEPDVSGMGGPSDDPLEELWKAALRAIRDGSHAVIGGSAVCAQAQRENVAHRFIASGSEGLKNALDVAQRVCYAIDLKKSDSAEMDAMLNHTFNGIMQVDRQGLVLRANKAMLRMLSALPRDVLGHGAAELFPALPKEAMDSVLSEGKEVFALLVPLHGKQTVLNIMPIQVEREITGAILTFQEGQRLIEMDSELRRELFKLGYVARYRFDQLPAQSEKGRQALELASRIARYSAPVLITGEWGSGKSILAECIHNASAARDQAYIPLDCSAWNPDTLDTMLFGNHTTRKDTPACLAEIAREGTLYLAHVDALSPELQYKLLRLIRGSFIHNGSNMPSALKVRVIASTDVNLIRRVEQNAFRSDLYYALNVLGISLEPLRRRKEDISGWMDFYLNKWQEHYQRRVNLTQGAKAFLQAYDWPGNLNQMDSVCERIVLLAERRNVDEVFLRRQMEQIAPVPTMGAEQAPLSRDPRAAQIVELLKKHNGNRQKAADELGVSKTTLWRHMKKYGIEKDFSL